ncbi:MAG: ParB N-terminal domain-containing protein [Eubacteriales bacterium]|nr:ParB N-terminal domain-containing protein [Christensenellaceae bacterium]MEA5066774.1 ParB N-terminal domain-containing protein [Eubacteriales bacterium]
MKVDISNIHVANRIRREVGRIPELAADIRKNGLISPITVMPLDDGGYRLLAGLRRLEAVKSLGESAIETTILPINDAESALLVEISENEQRENFTLAERMDYAATLEEIERAKAKERMLAGKKSDPVPNWAQGGGKTREIVAPKVGMSRGTYARAKFVANKAPELIAAVDRKEMSVHEAYKAARAAEKPSEPAKSEPPKGAPKPVKYADYEAVQSERNTFAGKYAEASHKREMLETQLHNVNVQWQCEREGKDETIKRLQDRVADLEDALAAANARIKELEDEIKCGS